MLLIPHSLLFFLVFSFHLESNKWKIKINKRCLWNTYAPLIRINLIHGTSYVNVRLQIMPNIRYSCSILLLIPNSLLVFTSILVFSFHLKSNEWKITINKRCLWNTYVLDILMIHLYSKFHFSRWNLYVKNEWKLKMIEKSKKH